MKILIEIPANIQKRIRNTYSNFEGKACSDSVIRQIAKYHLQFLIEYPEDEETEVMVSHYLDSKSKR